MFKQKKASTDDDINRRFSKYLFQVKYYFVKTRKLEPRLVSVKCSDVMSLLKEKGLNLSKRMLA